MCLRQKCFRARLTAKPWRAGVAMRMKPRPGVWPVNPARMADRVQWVAEYERVSTGFAACRYLETIGSGTVDAEAELVRVVHDELAKAESGLPLA
jgi:hypothetical protein